MMMMMKQRQISHNQWLMKPKKVVRVIFQNMRLLLRNKSYLRVNGSRVDQKWYKSDHISRWSMIIWAEICLIQSGKLDMVLVLL